MRNSDVSRSIRNRHSVNPYTRLILGGSIHPCKEESS